MGPVLVIATIHIATAIITEATLSFLGVGVPATRPSLGTLIRVGNEFLYSGEWWITVFPGAALVILVLSVNLLGDWLRDALNPRAAMILEVEHLKVQFPTRRGTLTAVDDVSLLHRARARCSAWSANPAPASRITGMAVIGLLEPPGRIAAGEVRLEGRRIDNLPHEELRRIRGRRIGVIFQDPLTSLNPLYTIGQQLEETILTHLPLNRAQARERALSLLRRGRHSRAGGALRTAIRTISPAACASAW